VLQAAAALNDNCDPETLREVVRADTPTLLTILDTLQDARLLIAEELYPVARFGFAHPLIQEVALDSQLASRLQMLHRRIAEVLTARAEAGKDVDAGAIAAHWEGCSEGSIAATWHATAAARTGDYNSGTAVLHWRKVLDLADPSAADLRLSACRALISLGPETDVAEEEAERIFEEGLKLARSRRDLSAMTLLFDGYASFRANQGDLEKALSYSLASNQIAERLEDPRLRLAMRAHLAVRSSFAGRIRENIPWVDRALAEASADRGRTVEVGADDPYTVLVFQKALLGMWSGHLARARQELTWVLQLGQDRNARSVVGWAHAFFPELAWFSGEDEAALEHARLSRQIAERIGSRTSLVIASRALGIAHILAGNWDDAVRELEDVVELARRQGTLLQLESDLVAHLGAAQLGLGDSDAALASARQAIEIGSRQRARIQELRALVVAVYTRLARGGAADLEDAAREVGAARWIVEDSGATVFEPVIFELDAELALRRGDATAFETGLDQARALYRQIGAEAQVRRLGERVNAA
jgi:adenylate cyclase